LQAASSPWLEPDQDDETPAGWMSRQLAGCPTRTVPIESLILGQTPRNAGADAEYVRTLSCLACDLPPIVVRTSSGEVIDGVHRVRAAMLRGETTIRARLYQGPAEDAFVIGVRLNSQHGLPLSRADRTAAAKRIIRSHPHWSNRMIAGVAGLAEGTVRGLRRAVGEPDAPAKRLGKDGRLRPVNGTVGRIHVRRLLAERPTASARSIAREADVSVNTVLDVKKRLAAGEDVVTTRGHATEVVHDLLSGPDQSPEPPKQPKGDAETLLSTLARDPSLRQSGTGRLLLGWMNVSRNAFNAVDEMPEHWVESVAAVARTYSELWREMAERLEKRL
jgi:ParB-like chromosome segregation protein Spo0J